MKCLKRVNGTQKPEQASSSSLLSNDALGRSKTVSVDDPVACLHVPHCPTSQHIVVITHGFSRSPEAHSGLAARLAAHGVPAVVWRQRWRGCICSASTNVAALAKLCDSY